MPLPRLRHLFFTVLALAALASLAAATYAGLQELTRRQIEQSRQTALALPLAADVRLRIAPGTPLSGIARAAAVHLPIDAATFIALARRQGAATSLKAGVYDFRAGQTMAQIIADMAAGRVTVEKITLIEGKTYRDWRRQLAADPRLKQRLATMTEAAILATLGITLANPEGLFLPDTYFFHSGDSDLSILRRARTRLQRTLDEHWQNRPSDLPLSTPYEALVLASIVEKETGKAAERPLIAAVFANRLRARMRLQADPTVIYGLGDEFDGNLTRTHLRRRDTPYNTYMRGGLPPTPIAMPGAASIAAALNPADSPYYYFVATGDGGHHFSQNLRQHNNAVNRYQRRRRR